MGNLVFSSSSPRPMCAWRNRLGPRTWGGQGLPDLTAELQGAEGVTRLRGLHVPFSTTESAHKLRLFLTLKYGWRSVPRLYELISLIVTGHLDSCPTPVTLSTSLHFCVFICKVEMIRPALLRGGQAVARAQSSDLYGVTQLLCPGKTLDCPQS